MVDTRSPEVRAALKKIPPALRLTIEAQCGGDWRRVTVDEQGSLTVHNRPQMRTTVLPDAKPPRKRAPSAKKKTAVVPEAPQEPPERPVEPLQRVTPAETIKPGVRVVYADTEPRPSPLKVSPRIVAPETFDWSTIDPNATAIAMADRFKDGLPKAIRYTYYEDVEALVGLDKTIVADCLEHPQRVVVAPETATKKFPVLRFHRGDVTVALGLRDPHRPMVIAAYWQALLVHDGHHVNHTGGGGARKTGGVPGTSKAVIKALRNLGAELTFEEKTAEVKYEGQSLGHITTEENAPRATCETDWQRMQRKIHAIDQRVRVG